MAEAIITRRGSSSGTKPYVVSATLSSTNTHFGDTAYGVPVAYFENGDIYISVKRGNVDSDNSKILNFILASAPEGVTLDTSVLSYAPNGSYAKNKIYGTILRGISSEVAITVNIPFVVDDTAEAHITVTEV